MRLFSSLLVLSTFLVIQSLADDCKTQNKCECVSSNGWGFDLTSIDSLEGILFGNKKFFFHPCGNTKILPDLPLPANTSSNICATNGYTLCMFDIATNVSTVLGTEEEMAFKREADSGEIVYTRGAITSSVTLECTPNAKTSLLYAPPDMKDQVILTLYSKVACSKQIEIDPEPRGLFYTFFIVILTLLFSYLFIGMLINYFFIGARGYELIPNYDFWCKAWRSTTLLFIYVKNGCRVIPTEDSYDAI